MRSSAKVWTVNEHPMPPPEGELIAAALRRIRPKLSIREAARRAGISEGWWRQVVRGYQPLQGGERAPMRGSAEVIAAMAQVVGVTPEQLEVAGREDAAAELRELPAPVKPEHELTLHELAAQMRAMRAEIDALKAQQERDRREHLQRDIDAG